MIEVVNYLKENNYTNVKYNEPLAKHTTFRVGGVAKVIVTPENKEKLLSLIEFLRKKNFRFKVLGNGSNILPSDKPYEGVIIKTNLALRYLNVEGDILTVGAGYPLVKLAYDMVNYSLTGLEFIGGIPGTVGGAIYMNAGAYNKEMKDVVLEVLLIDQNGNLVTYNNAKLEYSYRTSILQKIKPLLIIEAKLKVESANKDDIKALLDKRRNRRLETQPLEFPSGGSTFRNPEGTHAYILIDEAGLRGKQIGGAKISEKHCNFIINYQNASSQDIKDLVELVIREVYKLKGIILKPEIELFNW